MISAGRRTPFAISESRRYLWQKKSKKFRWVSFTPFPNHPFGVRDDKAMAQTVESIKEYGVLVPAIARPREDGGYEIIAGHRRKHACELAGRPTMPVIIRNIDRNTATIIMVDSNLQRESILPSEKAKAYKMKLEAISTMRASGGTFGMKKAACSGITAMYGQTAAALWTSTTATSRTFPRNIGSVHLPFLSAPQPHGKQNSPNDKICTFDIVLQFGYSIIKTIRK